MVEFRRLFVAAILLFVVPPLAPAHADPLDDGIAALAAKDFKARIAAVEALGASGDVRAVPALAALLAGELYIRTSDGTVVIAERREAVHTLIDPVTGAEIGVAPGSDLEKIRVNNRLRGVIRAALGTLNLSSRDPAKRIEAADAVFAASDAESVRLIETALARESDAAVRIRMERALAAVTLTTSQETAARAAALATLAAFADPDVRSLLSRLAADDTDPLAEGARDALRKIEKRLAAWRMVGNVFQGVSLGSVLLLAAIGLAITFGVMGVINMAHGELVMLGAYTTFIVQRAFTAFAPGALDYSLLFAVPAAFLVAGGVGVAIERGVIRFLYGRPLETLLATWGISLVLQQLVRTLFGPTNQEVVAPPWMSGAFETASGLVLTYNRMTIILFSLLVAAAVALVLRRTPLGLQMRAVTQNRRMAGSMGIRTGRVDAMTFGLGAGIAGVAGVALSQIDNVSPNLGQAYIVDSFMVVVFGGVGNLWGTLVGAFSLGIVNKFLEPYAGAVLAKILVLVAIILFIQKRPRGMFALKGRAAES